MLEQLLQNKEEFIENNGFENDEIAKRLIYSIPIELDESSLIGFGLLLSQYKFFLLIDNEIKRQGLYSPTERGVSINKLISVRATTLAELNKMMKSWYLDGVGILEIQQENAELDEDNPILDILKMIKGD